MAKSYEQVNFRIPTELKDKIAESAKDNQNSITAELVYRLEKSFSNSQTIDAYDPDLKSLIEDQSKYIQSLKESLGEFQQQAREMRQLYVEAMNRTIKSDNKKPLT